MSTYKSTLYLREDNKFLHIYTDILDDTEIYYIETTNNKISTDRLTALDLTDLLLKYEGL